MICRLEGVNYVKETYTNVCLLYNKMSLKNEELLLFWCNLPTCVVGLIVVRTV